MTRRPRAKGSRPSRLTTTPERSALLGRVRQKGTTPEVVVQEMLTRLGHAYSTNVRGIPGSPDIVAADHSRAVFVHGCYWHRHPGCPASSTPTQNAEFWKEKFVANVRRDRRKARELRKLGYRVMTVWECQTKSPEKRARLERRLDRFFREGGVMARAISKKPLTSQDEWQKTGSEGEAHRTARTPESYRLSDDGCSIERVIALRAGGVTFTRIPIDTEETLDTSEDGLADRFDRAFLYAATRPRIGPRAREIRVVDLFSGCGAMSLGIWEASRAVGARMVPVMALDFNQSALRVYEDNFPGVWAVSKPIESMLDGALGSPASAAERDLVVRLGDVDVLIGGPPCQGHSNLNNHTRREDPKNKLYDRMARFAELVGPTHVIIENVSAVLHDKGEVVDRTIAHLKQLGYLIDNAVVEAIAIGVPQHRRRHFVVASRERKPDIRATISAFRRRERHVTWAIGDLEGAPQDTIFDQTSTPSPVNRERIDYLFANRLYELPDEMRPDCHRLEEHSYKSVYGRLRPNKPAQTITSGFLSMGQGRYVHPTQRRTITPHEAARLQFIPDFFDFGSVSKRTALAEMIGNAVPSKLAYVLGVELLR